MFVPCVPFKDRCGNGSHQRSKAAVACAIAFALLSAIPARGDIYGRISGVITDPSGAAVPNATVTLTNVDTGVNQKTKSLDQGSYAFPAVPIGHYDLEIQKPGFAASRETGIVIDVNSVKIIDFHMTLAADVQQVQVNAETAAQVDTAGTQVGVVIDDAKMENVPLNGRNFTDLMSLQPGVVPTSSNEGSGYGSLSVNGARESGDAYLVNGGSVENGQFMTAAVTPNLDSIAEFRIITSTFDAEYGQFYGAQVNVATKSGTDRFHGSTFDFLRNTDFNARQYFAGVVPQLIQNQFGGTLGGPVVRKKLFFFGDYQGTRALAQESSGPVYVPSSAERNGDFSAPGLAAQLTGSVQGSSWANTLSGKLGYAVTAQEPYYFPGCTTATCVFPGAQIPAQAIDPIATSLLKYVPGFTSGLNYYITNTPRSTSNDDEGAIRIDFNHRLGNLSLYFYDDHNGNVNPFGTDSLPGYPTIGNGYSTMWNIGLTSTISPTKLNEFRLHAMHNGGKTFPGGTGGTSTGAVGFVTGANTEGVVINSPNLDGLPNFATNEFSSGVSWLEGGSWYSNYQLSDNFSIQSGKHSIKFGGAIYNNEVINKAIEFTNGTFSFNGQETGSDIADMLIGALTSFAQGVEYPFHMHARNFGIFAEDSWRARTDLTLNLGLRWDVPKPWAEENGEITNLLPGEQSIEFPNAPRGLVFPGDPGVSKSQAPNRYDTLAPRFGLAYSPSASPNTALGRVLGKPGNTSIHAGFGVFYTALEEELANIDIGAAPFGEFYATTYLPELATPFVERPSGIPHLQAFPVPYVAPPSRSRPNNMSFAAVEPIAASPGYWHDNVIPYAYQLNFTVQRQITSRDLLQAGYVASRGHSLVVNTEANPGNQALCLSLSQPSEVAPGSPTCGPYNENGVFTAANGTVSNSTRGPFGIDFASDGIFRTIGVSWYDSLQASWKHQEKSLEFLLGYTFSKSIDSGSGWSEMLNPVNPSLNHALSSFDLPHNFVASYQWELPFSRFHHDRLTEGWIVSGITHFASGLPVSMYELDDNSLLGDGGSGGGFGADTPVYNPGKLHLGIPHHALGQPFTYFNTQLFSQDPLGGNGTSKVRFFHGPGIDNTDLSFMKNTRIRESLGLQIRFELFNAFNHTQYGQPNSTWVTATGGSNFGLVTGAAAARIGQAALKLRF